MKAKEIVHVLSRLDWPMRWKRTDPVYRTQGRFRVKNDAEPVDALIEKLQRMRCKQIRITSNRKFEGGTTLTSIGGAPFDPGVAVYFNLRGQDRVLACDRWSSVGANAQAIGLHVEALRGQERWGVGNIEQAFAGYTALPEKTGTSTCHEILGVEVAASSDEIKTAYRTRAKQCHPDAGGTTEAMAELNVAYEAALEQVQTQIIED